MYIALSGTSAAAAITAAVAALIMEWMIVRGNVFARKRSGYKKMSW